MDEVRKLGLPATGDPGEILLGEVRRTAGLVAWLQAEIERLPGGSAELVRGTRYIRRKETPDGVETTSEVSSQLSTLVEWWREERAHLVRACAAAIAGGVAERVARAAEAEAETMGSLVAAALDAAGVTGDARVRAVQVARGRFLSLVQGG